VKGWLLLLAVALALIASQGLRQEVAPLLPALQQRLALSNTAAGALISAFFLAYAALQLPAGLAADRLGGGRLMVAGLALLLAGGFGFAWAPSYAAALAARVVLGAGAALCLVPGIGLVARTFDPRRRGLAFGVVEAAQGAGMLVGLSAVPWLLPPAALAGAVVLPLALLARLAPGAEGGGGARGSLRSVAGEPVFWRLGLVSALGLSAFSGSLGWLPTFAERTLHLGALGAAAAMACLVAVNMATAPAAGHLCDRSGRRLAVIAAGSLALAAGAGACALADGGARSWFWLGAALLGAGMGVGIGPMFTVTAEYFGTARAATVTGGVNLLGQLGAMLGGVGFGWVLDRTGSFRALWLVAAGLACARAVVAARIPDLRRAEVQP
jgi:MFS family permease